MSFMKCFSSGFLFETKFDVQYKMLNTILRVGLLLFVGCSYCKNFRINFQTSFSPAFRIVVNWTCMMCWSHHTSSTRLALLESVTGLTCMGLISPQFMYCNLCTLRELWFESDISLPFLIVSIQLQKKWPTTFLSVESQSICWLCIFLRASTKGIISKLPTACRYSCSPSCY